MAILRMTFTVLMDAEIKDNPTDEEIDNVIYETMEEFIIDSDFVSDIEWDLISD